MWVKVSPNNQTSNEKISFQYRTQDTCPVCKAKIEPVYIGSCYSENKNVYVFDYCRSCNETFITAYTTKRSGGSSSAYSLTADKILYSEPKRFQKYIFDERIQNLSPQFDKIYNQAREAEAMGLDEIAGIGYRKALEFLSKDFAIHNSPEETEEIKQMPLSKCINTYMSDEIRTLLERSAWIGNDETHYLRKQEDCDVADLKSFIQAAVYFIGMVLITEEAESISPK